MALHWDATKLWGVRVVHELRQAPWTLCALAKWGILFLWTLFKFIHSDMRLLCGVDALLGAAVGYAAGSALVGVMGGGALGVANYALITERWLRPRGYLPARP